MVRNTYEIKGIGNKAAAHLHIAKWILTVMKSLEELSRKTSQNKNLHYFFYMLIKTTL